MTEALDRAVNDYRWMLDRGYPDQGAIKLVGDRYRLTSVERAVLLRGVFGAVVSRRRSLRLWLPSTSGAADTTPPPTDRSSQDCLWVDGHNVLFTIWNCLAGRPMVRATDGFIRDIGGTRSRLPHDARFTRVARVLVEHLRPLPFLRVVVLLDAPLPWSREHAAELELLWRARHGTVRERDLETRVIDSVDAEVARVTDGLIATSDTGIIDRCAVQVFDLGGFVVSRAFAPNLLDVQRSLTRVIE